MQQAVKSARATSQYAVARDFCRIFAEQVDGLYVLALLLTGNHQNAQQCFVYALEECFKTTDVFKDWARSWARRAVVQTAIHMLQPKHSLGSAVNGPKSGGADRSRLSTILNLGTFERFVFVLSVLEGFSDHECKTLLDSTRGAVIEARTRALKSIGEWGTTQREIAAITDEGRMFARAS